MTAPASVNAPAVPIRAQTIEHLTREFGVPESGKDYERWVVNRPKPRHPVHVMVNGCAASERAHIFIFDPGASNGHNILEMDLLAIDELLWLVEHIKHSVSPRLKQVVEAEQQETFR